MTYNIVFFKKMEYKVKYTFLILILIHSLTNNFHNASPILSVSINCPYSTNIPISPDISDQVYFSQMQTNNCFFCVLVLFAGNFCYATIISAITDSAFQCAENPILFTMQELNSICSSCYSICSQISLIFSSQIIKQYYFFTFLFIYKMFYILKKRNMLFWCFQCTFQCSVLINFETWHKKDALGKIETQQ